MKNRIIINKDMNNEIKIRNNNKILSWNLIKIIILKLINSKTYPLINQTIKKKKKATFILFKIIQIYSLIHYILIRKLLKNYPICLMPFQKITINPGKAHFIIQPFYHRDWIIPLLISCLKAIMIPKNSKKNKFSFHLIQFLKIIQNGISKDAINIFFKILMIY